MAAILNVTDESFEQAVLQSPVPVAVDFWAPWCPPCRAIAPLLGELSSEYDGRLNIVKLDTDEHQRWAASLGIRGLPTLIIFKDGREIDRIIGAKNKKGYQEHFNAAIEMLVAS